MSKLFAFHFFVVVADVVELLRSTFKSIGEFFKIELFLFLILEIWLCNSISAFIHEILSSSVSVDKSKIFPS